MIKIQSAMTCAVLLLIAVTSMPIPTHAEKTEDKAVTWAIQNQILRGRSNKDLALDAIANQAEFSTFFLRFLWSRIPEDFLHQAERSICVNDDSFFKDYVEGIDPNKWYASSICYLRAYEYMTEKDVKHFKSSKPIPKMRLKKILTIFETKEQACLIDDFNEINFPLKRIDVIKLLYELNDKCP